MMTMCLSWIDIYKNNLQMDDVSGPSWSPDNSRYSYYNVNNDDYLNGMFQRYCMTKVATDKVNY